MKNPRGFGKAGRAFMAMLTLAAATSLSACSALTLFGSTLEGHSRHFHVHANSFTSSQAEVRQTLTTGETLHAAIAAKIPDTIPLNRVIEVRLEGDVHSKTPYVDDDGVIHLYRFSAFDGGYRALFAHELVHAIALDAQVEFGTFEWPSAWFYFEGWAEYLAQVVDPHKTGFPLYGFDQSVVVGYLLSHHGLTLDRLRRHHDELSVACQFQSYPMRASWFAYVVDTHGYQAATAIAYSRQAPTPAYVRSVLGEPLDVVDAQWRRWIMARYAARPDAAAQIAQYRRHIPSWYRACD